MEPDNKMYTESYIKADMFKKYESENLKTIGDCLKHFHSLQGKNDAFVFASSERKEFRTVVSWKDLYEKSVLVAKSLIALGVKRDEVIGINMRSCPEWLYLVFGAIIAGIKVAGVAFTYTDGSDLISLFKRLKTCSILALDPGPDNENWEILQKLIDEFGDNGTVRSEKIPSLRFVIGQAFSKPTRGVKFVKDLMNDLNDHITLPNIDENDIAILFQTSGSTGIPKFVAHTHASLFFVRRMMSTVPVWGEFKVYNDRPFAWAGGSPMWTLTGQTRVTMSGFCKPAKDRIARMFQVIVEEQCTMVQTLPQQLIAMNEAKDRLPHDWPVDTISTGGQPLTKNIVQVVGKLCRRLMCSYGATEFLMISQNFVTHSSKFCEYSSGLIFPGSGVAVKIVGDDGSIVPINIKGELYVKSPGMFKEYFNDPDKTAAAFTDDGWYKTDDLGRLTETGHLSMEGRKSNVIISGGMNVSPEILETVIKRCPGIQAVIIVPVPDEVYYQVLCACVVLKSGSKITEESIREFCRSFHNDKPGLFTVMPKHYMFLDSLPETHSGKTARNVLEEIAKQKFAA